MTMLDNKPFTISDIRPKQIFCSKLALYEPAIIREIYFRPKVIFETVRIIYCRLEVFFYTFYGAIPRTLFWRFANQYAVRQGNWKLISAGPQTELFDLAADISEARNLAAEQPNVVKKLTKSYEKWNAQTTDPLWPRYVHKT